jgi:DnaJ-class molecular chaperone
MGSKARELLKESYRRNKVKFHPKHQLSPEALEKMREIGRNNLLMKRISSGV